MSPFKTISTPRLSFIPLFHTIWIFRHLISHCLKEVHRLITAIAAPLLYASNYRHAISLPARTMERDNGKETNTIFGYLKLREAIVCWDIDKFPVNRIIGTVAVIHTIFFYFVAETVIEDAKMFIIIRLRISVYPWRNLKIRVICKGT